MLEYKGYLGRVEFDDDAEIFHGDVINLDDVITFQGTSVEELKPAFKDSVEVYLDVCASRGEQPAPPYFGSVVVTVPPRSSKTTQPGGPTGEEESEYLDFRTTSSGG